MIPKDIIEKEMAKELKGHPEKVSAVNAVVEMVITGANGGTWTIDCTKAGGSISSGSSGNAKLTVTVSDSDFVDLYQGKLNPQMAFMSGKVKVKGDIGLALKLGNLLKQ